MSRFNTGPRNTGSVPLLHCSSPASSLAQSLPVGLDLFEPVPAHSCHRVCNPLTPTRCSRLAQCTPMHSYALLCTPMHCYALLCTPMHCYRRLLAQAQCTPVLGTVLATTTCIACMRRRSVPLRQSAPAGPRQPRHICVGGGHCAQLPPQPARGAHPGGEQGMRNGEKAGERGGPQSVVRGSLGTGGLGKGSGEALLLSTLLSWVC